MPSRTHTASATHLPLCLSAPGQPCPLVSPLWRRCAGANSVVACDLHSSLCDVARKAASANKLSRRVSVVHRDSGLLQRGREVRPLGVNVVVADVFDAGGWAGGMAACAGLRRSTGC